MRRHVPTSVAHVPAVLVAAVAALVAGCGGQAGSPGGAGDRPTVVVTTTILGDVVRNLTAGMADVEVMIPAGVDPHEFRPSARQVAELREADVVVANGAGLDAGLLDAIEGAEEDGATVFTAIDHVEALDHDPHFFTDPARMAAAARALTDVLAADVPALDDDRFRSQADAYAARLDALDGEVEDVLADVPPERRKLVTVHEVLGYFADRYGFEVVGAVIPATTTESAPSAAAIDALAAAVEDVGVPAVFADTSSPDDLADALAAEVGDVEVVELYSETLGGEGSGADTYLGMIRTNAGRIADALAP